MTTSMQNQSLCTEATGQPPLKLRPGAAIAFAIAAVVAVLSFIEVVFS